MKVRDGGALRRLALAKEFRRLLGDARRNHDGRREVDALAAAEARLDAGVFGVCEVCGRPISLTRLRAAPTARRCGRCAGRT